MGKFKCGHEATKKWRAGWEILNCPACDKKAEKAESKRLGLIWNGGWTIPSSLHLPELRELGIGHYYSVRWAAAHFEAKIRALDFEEGWGDYIPITVSILIETPNIGVEKKIKKYPVDPWGNPLDGEELE